MCVVFRDFSPFVSKKLSKTLKWKQQDRTYNQSLWRRNGWIFFGHYHFRWWFGFNYLSTNVGEDQWRRSGDKSNLLWRFHFVPLPDRWTRCGDRMRNCWRRWQRRSVRNVKRNFGVASKSFLGMGSSCSYHCSWNTEVRKREGEPERRGNRDHVREKRKEISINGQRSWSFHFSRKRQLISEKHPLNIQQ